MMNLLSTGLIAPISQELVNNSSTHLISVLLWLAIAVPIVGALISLLFSFPKLQTLFPYKCVFASVVCSGLTIVALWQFITAANSTSIQSKLFTWFSVGSLQVDFGIKIDSLSMAFVAMISFVAMLIHIYSLGYMKSDPQKQKFFAYLNLFLASMLILVLANNFVLMFLGWEGVGLASYLLIGFWNYNKEYAVAAKKAFITNRVGDFGMIVAIALIIWVTGSAQFSTVLGGSTGGISIILQNGSHGGNATLWVIRIALLLAACGKSAQFPLQSWLGDAMAGPTPVSALIHAATMVTAGIYLVVRTGVIFGHSYLVCIVGAISLIYGAVVGCAKDDMKKVLAASTMSQIGYMMLAAGLGPIGVAFAIMHLLVHGFFKAGLFLSAGSVMHSMDNETDIRKFGALKNFIKVTWLVFMACWLAILGVPPFSGFWSKDKIIEAAFSVGTGFAPWIFGSVALLGAAITSFYMSRLFFMIFYGNARFSEENKNKNADSNIHESSLVMLIPMIILSVGAIFGGWILSAINFSDWLNKGLSVGYQAELEPVINSTVLVCITLVLVVLATAFAYVQYVKKEVSTIAPKGTVITRMARADLYQDSFNNVMLVKPGNFLAKALDIFDRKVVDGIVNGLGAICGFFGVQVKKSQVGLVRFYVLFMLIGSIIILAIVLFGKGM